VGSIGSQPGLKFESSDGDASLVVLVVKAGIVTTQVTIETGRDSAGGFGGLQLPGSALPQALLASGPASFPPEGMW
jgi:hypothetical protein